MGIPVFNSRNTEYKSRLSPVSAGESLMFSIVLHDSQNCSGAFLVIWRDGESEQYIEMNNTGKIHEEYTRWTVHFVPEVSGIYWYRFEFDGNRQRHSVTRFAGGEGQISDRGKPFQLTVYEPDFCTPEVIKDGIIYQIFPDRFYCSESPKKNIPENRYLCSDWHGQPAYLQNGKPYSLGNDYYGGDLRGIEQKLDYLTSLGVSAIYLNPIFEAHSNHRYNTADYFKIDPLLGTEDDFILLCKNAKNHGIRIILDGVFSHTGSDSVYFNKNNRYADIGAYNSVHSPYFRWFKFNHWPDEYVSWWGVPTLPEVNELDESFAAFICGENGVLRHWLRLGASGWRLDVADELPDAFLERVRLAVKAENPDALLLGEVWEDASNKISYGKRRSFLLGKQLDSVMNYPFRNAIIDFLSGGNSSDLEDCVLELLENYPKQSVDTLMNHIGTHDTARILTVLAGEPQGLHDRDWQSRQTLSAEQREKGIKLVKLAATLQYTLPGVPSVYYGDEAGLEGYSDPFNRGGYPWGRENASLLDFYKWLGRLRRVCPAFAGGEFLPVFSGFGHIAYIRKKGSDEVLVAVNRWCDDEPVQLPDGWDNAAVIFGTRTEKNVLRVPCIGISVLGKGNWTKEFLN